MTKYFEIDGKELELKITWEGAKRLNEHFGGEDDGAMAVVGKAIQGDLDTIPKVIQSALIHERRYPLKTIEDEIAKGVESGELDLFELMKLVKETVADSFFYKRAYNQMMKMAGDNEAKEALENFYKISE